MNEVLTTTISDLEIPYDLKSAMLAPEETRVRISVFSLSVPRIWTRVSTNSEWRVKSWRVFSGSLAASAAKNAMIASNN